MKKLFLLLVIVASGAASLFAQEPLPFFVNFSSKSWGEFVPGEADRQFDYNAETGRYEIVVDYDTKLTDCFMRFYQKDGDEIIPWNTFSWTRLSMLSNKEYELPIDEGRVSPLQIIKFYGEVDTAPVKISTVPNDTVLYLKQIVEKEFIPEKIYVWGSNTGGFSSKVFATMEPAADNPYFFSTDIEMPTWYFDPKGVMADFAANAFVFALNTRNDGKSGTSFRAHLPYETEDLSLSSIWLRKGETFSTTLQTEIQESIDLSCHTPGRMHITFDYSTLEFTATMLDPMNHVSLAFDGIDTYVHNKYIDVFCAGEEVPLFVNPQNIWYTAENLNLKVVPKEGYAVTMESLIEEADFVMTESDGAITVESDENGLAFLVYISKIDSGEEPGGEEPGGEEPEHPGGEEPDGPGGDDSGIKEIEENEVTTVYNLQGIPVAKGTREVMEGLPSGIYIISGKKVKL